MIDLLFAPIDPTRAHDVSLGMAWHGRLMFLAWGIICPLVIVSARYFKILDKQAWPQELDNRFWWRSHWIGQTFAMGLSCIGLALILWTPGLSGEAWLHRVTGYAILALGSVQLLSGFFRGSKGGPTHPSWDGTAHGAPDDEPVHGDHFDMTRRRLLFERVHRTVGYTTLMLVAVTILNGMWAANAPIWMWAMVGGWWTALISAAVWLQLHDHAYDTYQAIYGPNPDLPGNRMPQQGWRTVRPSTIILPRQRIGE